VTRTIEINIKESLYGVKASYVNAELITKFLDKICVLNFSTIYTESGKNTIKAICNKKMGDIYVESILFDFSLKLYSRLMMREVNWTHIVDSLQIQPKMIYEKRANKTYVSTPLFSKESTDQYMVHERDYTIPINVVGLIILYWEHSGVKKIQ